VCRKYCCAGGEHCVAPDNCQPMVIGP
jgi:hypothetical protein